MYTDKTIESVAKVSRMKESEKRRGRESERCKTNESIMYVCPFALGEMWIRRNLEDPFSHIKTPAGDRIIPNQIKDKRMKYQTKNIRA